MTPKLLLYCLLFMFHRQAGKQNPFHLLIIVPTTDAPPWLGFLVLLGPVIWRLKGQRTPGHVERYLSFRMSCPASDRHRLGGLCW